MAQGVSPEEIRQLGRYSTAYIMASLPFVALVGFGVAPPWLLAAAAIPVGAAVGAFTLKPREAGLLAGATGLFLSGLVSWAVAELAFVFDPKQFGNPRAVVALGIGPVLGCLLSWLVWDWWRGSPPSPDASGPGESGD